VVSRNDFDWNESPPSTTEIEAAHQRAERSYARAERRAETAWDLVDSGRVWLLGAGLLPLGIAAAFMILPRWYAGWAPLVLWGMAVVGTAYGGVALAGLVRHVRRHPRSSIAAAVRDEHGEYVRLGQVVQWVAYSVLGLGMLMYLAWDAVQGLL